jgi:hypothetical protein
VPSAFTAEIELDDETEFEVEVELEVEVEVDVADAPRVLVTEWLCAPPPPTEEVPWTVVPVMRLDELLPDAVQRPGEGRIIRVDGDRRDLSYGQGVSVNRDPTTQSYPG